MKSKKWLLFMLIGGMLISNPIFVYAEDENEVEIEIEYLEHQSQYARVIKTTKLRSFENPFEEGENLKKSTKVYRVTKKVRFEERTWYLIRTKEKELGYIGKDAVALQEKSKGTVQKSTGYILFKGKNPVVWKDKDRTSHKKIQDVERPLKVTGKYSDYNGSQYLQLKNYKNQFVGYVNQEVTEKIKLPVSQPKKMNQFIKVTVKKPVIWSDFKGNRAKDRDLSGKILLAKSKYLHINGNYYIEVYNLNQKLIGYINAEKVKKTKSPQERMKKVQQLLNQEKYAKSFGIYVELLEGGTTAQKNANKRMHSASTGKLPILYYTQKMLLEQKVDAEKQYVYTDKINRIPKAYMRGGAGILQSQPFGKKYTIPEMMKWTAKYSDNQGANFLAYYAGNRYDTKMHQEISQVIGETWETPFSTTAAINASLMRAIYFQGGPLINNLSNTVFDNERIAKYLPVKVAHKIGDVFDVHHDAAIVYASNPYVLSILTKNSQSYESISKLSKKIYQILTD